MKMESNTIVKQRFNNPLLALKHRNFRYYWIGMCISVIGTWMQNVAQPWLAYDLTKSPFLLSLVGTLQFVPALLFSLFAGVVIDKFRKRNILLFTQSASLIITLILGLLVLSGNVKYWHILVLSFALGLVNTLDIPTRHSFIIELVGKEDLMNAVALNSTIFNVARVVGPAIAGIIMGYFGIASCFLVNAVSFSAVVISLLFINPKESVRRPSTQVNIFRDIYDGLKFIYQNKVLVNAIIIMLIVGIFAINFNVSLPVFAKEILKQKETGFGFLMSFMGLGSLLGAILIATTSKSGPNKFVIYFFPLINGVFLVLSGLTNKYILTGLCLAIAGFCFVSFNSTANSLMQLSSNDEYRGRVTSVYTLVFAGSTPIGNFFTGMCTEKFGPRMGLIACGVMIIILLIVMYIYNYFTGAKPSSNSKSA